MNIDSFTLKGPMPGIKTQNLHTKGINSSSKDDIFGTETFDLHHRSLNASLFCYALLCVHSCFAIILKRKGKLVALLLLS